MVCILIYILRMSVGIVFEYEQKYHDGIKHTVLLISFQIWGGYHTHHVNIITGVTQHVITYN